MHQFSHSADIISLSGSGQILRFIESAKSWVVDNLPTINNDAQSGRISLNEMVSLLQPLVTEANQLVQFCPLHPWVARMLIQPLGFPISSLEKHFQEKQQPAGAGLASLVGAEDLLFWLGRMAHHPPRDLPGAGRRARLLGWTRRQGHGRTHRQRTQGGAPHFLARHRGRRELGEP